jgi:hypothetical protein
MRHASFYILYNIYLSTGAYKQDHGCKHFHGHETHPPIRVSIRFRNLGLELGLGLGLGLLGLPDANHAPTWFHGNKNRHEKCESPNPQPHPLNPNSNPNPKP